MGLLRVIEEEEVLRPVIAEAVAVARKKTVSAAAECQQVR